MNNLSFDEVRTIISESYRRGFLLGASLTTVAAIAIMIITI